MLISPYSPRYVTTLVYMLQNTEYHAGPYLAWYWRTQDFSKVAHRRQLVRTRAARLLTVALALGMVMQLVFGLALIALWRWHGLAGGWAFGLALIISYPVVWAHLAIVPLVVGRTLVVRPRERLQVLESEHVFKEHPAIKVAIAGSYGKTSMKELLLTILSEGKRVAATPANKNVAVSHAQFARTLKGEEEILLIEYGEGAPGDVRRFALSTHPTHAVITGVAPAHLDRYKTVAAAGRDIFSVADYLPEKHQCYVNDESVEAKHFMRPDFVPYDRKGAMGWKVGDVAVNLDGLSFTLTKGRQRLQLKSKLLGRHQLGPLSLAVALAYEFGLSREAIVAGIGKTMPFEHRMQPYQLAGAWVIDDTYNGNLEGVRAGTELLQELPARRKLYVTPGLVDQGKETERIHEEIGRLVAASGADVVVLMRNSVTEAIKRGLVAADFAGEVRTEPDPLGFYMNLTHFVSAGDVVLMQNDWPDNYV